MNTHQTAAQKAKLTAAKKHSADPPPVAAKPKKAALVTAKNAAAAPPAQSDKPPRVFPAGIEWCMVNVRTLEDARALVELAPGFKDKCDPVAFADGSIQRFKAADGRTMTIVAFNGRAAAMAV